MAACPSQSQLQGVYLNQAASRGLRPCGNKAALPAPNPSHYLAPQVISPGPDGASSSWERGAWDLFAARVLTAPAVRRMTLG